MIFICYIWSNFIISLIVDTNWWKNFGLSLLGSVGVPLTIWLLTRYYGADKAEERKELKELRNNLNLLLSLLYSNIEKMSILREHLLCVIDIERRNNIIYPNELNMIFSNLIAENYFEIIDITKYASCIAYDKDFVFNLVQLKNIIRRRIPVALMAERVGISAFVILFGLLNMVNMLISSAIVRKREFALLQAVGMTNQQLRKMLYREGMSISVKSAILATFFGVTVGALLCYLANKVLALKFILFEFNIFPVLLFSILLVGLQICISYGVSRSIEKDTLVERLRTE